MGFERRDEFVLEIDGPEDTFGTINADFTSVALRLPIWDLASGTLDYEALENPAYTMDLGEHERIKGLARHNQITHMTHAEGLVTAAGDSVTAAATAVTHLICGMTGQAPTLSTGSLSTDTPTPATSSVITEDAAGAHGVDQLVGVVIGTNVEVRPIYSYSTDTMTLGIACSAAPSNGAILYGAANCKWVDNPAALFSVQSRFVNVDSSDTELNQEIRGCHTALSLGEVGPAEVQTLNWTHFVGDFTDLYSDTQVAPTVNRPTVVAGGEFLIADAGSAKAGTAVQYGQLSIDFGATYTDVRAANAAIGLSGRVRDKAGKATVSITIPHDATPPTGISASTWRELWRTGGADNLVQLLCNFGQKTAGKIFSIWFKELILVGWEAVDVDGIAAQKLTFARKTGTTAPWCVIAQL